MRGWIILVLLSLLLLAAPGALAAEGTFRIEAVDIQAYVQANGDLEITELDSYRFDGTFNGILVDLGTGGSDGIVDFIGYAVTPQGARPLRVEETTSRNKVSYKLFEPSQDERKQFKLTYRVKNAVQVYQDTAELYWKFFDQANESQVETVRIYIHLPGNVSRESLFAYGHGALNGMVTVQEGGVVQYTVQPLYAKEMLEARLLFPPALVAQSAKVQSKPALERIRAEENRWADEADRRRGLAAQQYRQTLLMAAGAVAANLALLALLFLRYGKEHRPQWQGIYCRELPAEVTPAVMSYLMTYRVQARDLMATLMDLVRRKYVAMRVVETEGGWFQGKQRDYLFKLTNPDTERLCGHEQVLVKWLFSDPEGELSLKALQASAKQKATARAFMQHYNKWSQQAAAEARMQPWFETNAGPKLAVILGGLQVAVFIFLAPEEWKFLAVCALPLLFFGMKMKRRSQAGATEYRKWQALKRFLNDYSRLAEREPMAVHLWEQYLVYGISLGVAKRVIAISQLDLQQVDESHHHLYTTMIRHSIHERELDDVTQRFDHTVSTATSNAPASRGSGGSFSSGGGGGGGGGGRGAF